MRTASGFRDTGNSFRGLQGWKKALAQSPGLIFQAYIMFNTLTKSILNDLISYWIPLGDVGRLDFALCEPVQRNHFLDLLQTESFGRRSTEDKFGSNPSFLNWVIKRKVKLQLHELVVDDVLMRDVELQNKVFALVGPNLKKVTTSSKLSIDQVDRLVLELLLHCTNLQECQLNTFNDLPVMALLARNSKMKRVKLSKCAANKESDILHTIATLCPSIESIEIACSVAKRSVARFLESIPSSLTSLRLPSCSFDTHSLLKLLRQCPNLLELRIGDYSHYSVPKSATQLVHPCLKVFRTCSNTQAGSNLSTWIQDLSEFIPNLATFIVVNPAAYSDIYSKAAILDTLDSVQNVTLILNNFRYLRQLLIGTPNDESKLKALSPMPHIGSDKPGGKHATRRQFAVPKAGSLLEELFSNRMGDIVKSFSLPALCSVGCNLLYNFALPATVKRLVAAAGYYCNDEQLAKIRNLEEVQLELEAGVTDAGMLHIAHQNPHLRELRVTQKVQSSASAPLSAAGLWTILQHCPLLHTVVYKVIRYDRIAGSTMHSTDPLLQRMCAKSFPNVKHIEYSV